ncbi:hypothetical protein F0365_10105 [Nonlabens sp. Ci31]|uniref:hypothetical protein n=1 Tax=Nonlabens sp. Ci31 TaxID=2608253 RepID=UPI001463F337|nr:hypothetical protein [Nonlabens sp. Ci31]QJP34719.1 hypothetical protein F0365_10105 [Nonlabens sp. Ci31]
MKLFSVVILSILLLSNSARVSLVYGWYTLDVESFIEQLCENKDKPQLQCNGKCYLSKVSNDTSSEKEQTIPVLEWDQLVFCDTELSVEHQNVTAILGQKDFYYLITSTETYLHSIFHPPRV